MSSMPWSLRSAPTASSRFATRARRPRPPPTCRRSNPMKTSFKALCAGALLGVASLATQAAQVILVNTDPAGVGFNDPTAATPLGGNAGTTVGEQRLIAYGRALQLW